jgi:hypothetical protein
MSCESVARLETLECAEKLVPVAKLSFGAFDEMGSRDTGPAVLEGQPTQDYRESPDWKADGNQICGGARV